MNAASWTAWRKWIYKPIAAALAGTSEEPAYDGLFGLIARYQPLVAELTEGSGAAPPLSDHKLSLSARLAWDWFAIGSFSFGMAPEVGIRFSFPRLVDAFSFPEVLIDLPIRVSVVLPP